MTRVALLNNAIYMNQLLAFSTGQCPGEGDIGRGRPRKSERDRERERERESVREREKEK